METNRRTRPGLAGLILAMCLCVVSGCGVRYTDTEAFEKVPVTAQASDQPYTVAPPDVIKISSPQVPEINNVRVMVNPDGTIFLPLIGVVSVAGQTPVQIAAMLEDRALEYYQEAEVAVQVSDFRSKHLYVFGEVKIPGRYAWNGSDTLLDILSRAQPTRLAEPGRIHLFRPGQDGKPTHRMTIDLNDWVKKGNTDMNTLVAEGDIVYVPANGLATVGLAMQQLLLPIQPAASTVRGVTNMDQDTDSISTGSEGQ